jgi:hypothetical protein
VKGLRTFLLVGALLSSTVLHAQGVVLVQQQTRAGKSVTNQIQLDKTHVRAESRASGENVAFTFDDTAQIARMLNLDKKTYFEADGALRQQLQQQMAQMQSQLQNLPPQQRAVLEQAMRARGGVGGAGIAPAAKPEFKQTGSDKVGQWTCTKYEGYEGQKKVAEVCTVDAKDLGLTDSDFLVAKHLVEFLQGLLPQAASQIVVPGDAAQQGYAGVPVKYTSFVNGRADTTTETKEIRREAVPASAFEIPAGFRREDLAIPGARGR